ncbi:MAG: hypothetical protein R2729_21450 [Bryobacteraceae bacterium]
MEPRAITCAEAEILLAAELDNAAEFDAQARASLRAHRAGCPACEEMARDAAAAFEFLADVPPVEAPPALVNRILFHTAEQMRLAGGPPMPAVAAVARPWWRALLEPVLRPRLAMGMAMTILSFSMIGRLAGVPQRQLTADDLQPAHVWSTIDTRLQRVWDRAVMYYENLRLVYEVQDRLREWSEQEEKDARERRRAQPILAEEPAPDDRSPQGPSEKSRRGDR